MTLIDIGALVIIAACLAGIVRLDWPTRSIPADHSPDCLKTGQIAPAIIPHDAGGNASATGPNCLKTVQMSDSADRVRDCGGRA